MDDALRRRFFGEFEAFVAMLDRQGVALRVDDSALDETPDAHFPNNWFCTLPTGLLIDFPMAAANRRLERNEQLLENLAQDFGYRRVSLAPLEREPICQYLEGTGSLVMHHPTRTAFAAVSERTSPEALKEFERVSGYRAVPFQTNGPRGKAVYHTNVLMSIAGDTALCCLEAVVEKELMLRALDNLGLRVIDVPLEACFEGFACNALLAAADGHQALLMSASAKPFMSAPLTKSYQSVADEVLFFNVPTIEALGGGSVRCMLAELF